MPRDYQTETESLRARNEALWAELRRRDMEAFHQQQAAIERANAEAAERDRLAREEATAQQMEERRRAAWLSYRTDEALARGHDAFMPLLNRRDMLEGIPERAWPPGHEPPSSVPGIPDAPVDDASGTVLGQVLAKQGVRI